MSVSILQYPDSLMPVYNDIVFTVDSTNKTECSFRYICDIYVEGVFVDRLKLFPNSINGYASFKVNRVLEDYISYDLHNNLYGSNIFSENASTCKLYVLKFGEEYDSSTQCDTGTTVYSNLTITTSYYAFNAALQYEEWLSWSSTNYIMNSSSSLFLTTMPSEALISLGSQLTFNFINSGTSRKLQVKTYDSTGNLLGTYVYTNNYYTITGSINKIITVGVGPENLNNSTLASGSQPVITTSVYYYTIELLNAANATVSEIKRLDLDYRITPFNKHRFWWLNKLGGFDAYNYNMKDKTKVDSSRNFYNKLYGSYRVGSPNGSWAYDIGNRGKTVLSVNSQESSIYNSNWLTEDESLWMEGLFTSLEVYLSDVSTVDLVCGTSFAANFNSKLDPIIIKSTSYDEKIKYRIKNIDYQIEIEPSYSLNSQRN